MRYDDENAQLELTATELAGAVAVLGLTPGPLAPTGIGAASPDAERAFEDALASLSDAARDLLEQTLAVLVDPDRSLRLTTTAGESWLYRAVYAWRGGECVVLEPRARTSTLARVAAEDVSAAILTPLLGEGRVASIEAHAGVDGRAVVAFVAAADALRYGRMAALTSHATVPEAVTAAEVAARLADATVDDPRWTMSLYASVVPFDVSAFMDEPTTGLALDRLAGAGLFGVTERDGAFPATYHPTDEGLVALQTLAEADGRVAFTLFEKREEGIAYESVLVARGPLMTLACAVSPEGGGIAPAAPAGIAELAGRVAAG